MAIELTKERRAELVGLLQEWFQDHLEQEIGDLRAGLLLDLLLKEIGSAAYNQGIRDAQAYLQDKLMDLDGVHWEPEGSG